MPLNIGDATLEYAESGGGDPLILVHGSASDHRTWRAQLEAFSKDFRVIAYSRRYHWPNAQIPDDADYSMMEQVEDLGAVLDRLSEVPVHLVGHSYGAFLCLLLAIKAPNKVRSLILAEPPVLPLFMSIPPGPIELAGLLLGRPRTALAIIRFVAGGVIPATMAASRDDLETAMRRFGKAVLGARFFNRLPEDRWQQALDNAIRAEFLGSGFAALSADDVSRVRCPTLLITGEQSPALFHRLIDRLEQLLPHSDRKAIDNASHMMHEDNPAAFNEAVLAFFASRE